MKPLSELLEGVEPEPVNGFSGYVDYEDYERMRQAAVALTKCVEHFEQFNYAHDGHIASEALTRAREIIGEYYENETKEK